MLAVKLFKFGKYLVGLVDGDRDRKLGPTVEVDEGGCVETFASICSQQ